MALDLSPIITACNDTIMGKFNHVQSIVMEPPLFFESLNKLQSDLHTLTELHQVLESLVYVGRELLMCDDASVILWDPTHKEFAAGASTTKVGAEVPKRVRRKKGATRWIVDNQQPKFVEDTARNLAESNSMIIENDIRAYAGVPILFENEVLGVFYAMFGYSKTFNGDERYKLIQLANVASVSIKHAKQIQLLEERNQLLTTMMGQTVQKMVQPLSLAIGFCDLMVKEIQGMSAEHKKRVGIIQRSHTRMHHVISDIQRFEKLMSVNHLEFEPVSINYVVSSVQEAFQNGSIKNIGRTRKVQTFTDSTAPLVQANLGLLIECLTELVNWISRFTIETRPITIQTINQDDGVMISIGDVRQDCYREQNQSGDHLQMQLAPKSDTHQIGLGLSYVQAIVEMHGGYLRINNRAEQSSEFQLVLPK